MIHWLLLLLKVSKYNVNRCLFQLFDSLKCKFYLHYFDCCLLQWYHIVKSSFFKLSTVWFCVFCCYSNCKLQQNFQQLICCFERIYCTFAYVFLVVSRCDDCTGCSGSFFYRLSHTSAVVLLSFNGLFWCWYCYWYCVHILLFWYLIISF